MGTIDRHHEKRVFSEFNHTAVFDKDFNILWTDNPKLFHRIVVAHVRIEEKLSKASNDETVIHFFLYQGRYYRARINKFSDGNFICRIAKEITDNELKNEDLFEYIDDIAHASLNVYNMSDTLESYANISQYNIDKFHEGFMEQRKSTLSIHNKCINIINAFNDKSNDELIPLHKYLLRTLDIVNFAIKKYNRQVSMYLDPVFPAIKVDYSKFELALYNLIKICLIYGTGTEGPSLRIYATDINKISIDTNFRLNTEYKFMNCKLEMHVIKHIFKKMGGSFEFIEENNVLFARGTIEMEATCQAEDIAQGRDLKFVGDADLIEKKQNHENYLKIYQRVPAQKNMFASNTLDFTDVADDDIRFAELFFGDLEINS